MARLSIVARGRAGSSRRGRLALAAAVGLLLVFGLLGLAAPAGGVAAGLWEGMLYLLPALLLLVVLLARRYPGERLIGAFVRRARRAPASALAAVRRVELPVPHGGRLIAVSLAGRAPPPARAVGCG